jgi:hypothetical protein
MDFKQQKIMILCRFMWSDSDEKNHFVEQLDNANSKCYASYMVTIKDIVQQKGMNSNCPPNSPISCLNVSFAL